MLKCPDCHKTNLYQSSYQAGFVCTNCGKHVYTLDLILMLLQRIETLERMHGVCSPDERTNVDHNAIDPGGGNDHG